MILVLRFVTSSTSAREVVWTGGPSWTVGVVFWSVNIIAPSAPTDSSTEDNDHGLERAPLVNVDRARRVAIELKARVRWVLDELCGREADSKRRAAVRGLTAAIGEVMVDDQGAISSRIRERQHPVTLATRKESGHAKRESSCCVEK